MHAAQSTPHEPVLTATVGHFRERAGYRTWRPHGSGDWLLIYTVNGTGRIGRSPTRTIKVHAREMILFHPQTPQFYETCEDAGRWELIWSHFTPVQTWLPLLRWPERMPGLGYLRSAHPEIQDALHAMSREAQRYHREADRLKVNALERVLLLCHEHMAPHRALDDRVTRVIDALAAAPERDWHIAAMAELANLSASRFAHVFRDALQVTPRAFLEALRLRRASELLRFTQLQVKDIADRTGFDSQFYFSLRFKKQFGVSPTAYRESRDR